MKALPGLHAFPGCDSATSFHGISKRKCLNIVQGSEKQCNALGLLGQSFQVEDRVFVMIKSIVSQAYQFLNKHNVNIVRFEKNVKE